MIRTIETILSGLTIATTAYTSGDQVGNIFSFPNASDSLGGRGLIVGATILDEGDVLGASDLFLFTDSVTLAGDNAPFSISDADCRLAVSYVPFTAAEFTDLGNHKFGVYRGDSVPFHTTRADNALFGALITRTANSFFVTATDVRVRLYVNTGNSNIT